MRYPTQILCALLLLLLLLLILFRTDFVSYYSNYESIHMLDFADTSPFEENKVKKEIEEGVEPSLFLQLIFSL